MTAIGTSRAAIPSDEPGRTSVASGQVLLDGPHGIAVTLTPQAAAETGRRLIAAADAALKGIEMG